MTEEEWGPWIEHDGKDCPVQAGTYIQVEVHQKPIKVPAHWRLVEDRILEGIINNPHSRSWIWTKGFARILWYRVKKPKGLKVLEELLQNLPEPTKQTEKT